MGVVWRKDYFPIVCDGGAQKLIDRCGSFKVGKPGKVSFESSGPVPGNRFMMKKITKIT